MGQFSSFVRRIFMSVNIFFFSLPISCSFFEMKKKKEKKCRQRLTSIQSLSHSLFVCIARPVAKCCQRLIIHSISTLHLLAVFRSYDGSEPTGLSVNATGTPSFSHHILIEHCRQNKWLTMCKLVCRLKSAINITSIYFINQWINECE